MHALYGLACLDPTPPTDWRGVPNRVVDVQRPLPAGQPPLTPDPPALPALCCSLIHFQFLGGKKAIFPPNDKVIWDTCAASFSTMRQQRLPRALSPTPSLARRPQHRDGTKLPYSTVPTCSMQCGPLPYVRRVTLSLCQPSFRCCDVDTLTHLPTNPPTHSHPHTPASTVRARRVDGAMLRAARCH